MLAFTTMPPSPPFPCGGEFRVGVGVVFIAEVGTVAVEVKAPVVTDVVVLPANASEHSCISRKAGFPLPSVMGSRVITHVFTIGPATLKSIICYSFPRMYIKEQSGVRLSCFDGLHCCWRILTHG